MIWIPQKLMLDTGRYLYVAYMCQQKVEKMLKAIIATAGQRKLSNKATLIELTADTRGRAQTFFVGRSRLIRFNAFIRKIYSKPCREDIFLTSI